jgi:hypothetical protein
MRFHALPPHVTIFNPRSVMDVEERQAADVGPESDAGQPKDTNQDNLDQDNTDQDDDDAGPGKTA